MPLSKLSITFPPKKAFSLGQQGSNVLMFFTGSFLFYTCISSENSESDKRLNARRFNSTFTALSATFTHFVAINHWRFTHKQISQWPPSHRGDPLELRLRLIVIENRFIAQHTIESFFLEQQLFGIWTEKMIKDLLSVSCRDEAKSLTHSLGFLLRLLGRHHVPDV